MSSLSLVLLALLSTACHKENPSPSDLGVFLQGGTWRITDFQNSGTDATAQYADYQLSFADSSVVTAATSDTSVIGTYTSFTQDGQTVLRLVFDSGTDMGQLHGDWDVRTRGKGHLRLDNDQADVETDIYDVVVMVLE